MQGTFESKVAAWRWGSLSTIFIYLSAPVCQLLSGVQQGSSQAAVVWWPAGTQPQAALLCSFTVMAVPASPGQKAAWLLR